MQSAEKPSLYDRLGGVYLHRYCGGRPHRQSHGRPETERQSSGGRRASSGAARGFKYLVTEMVCWAAGGPHKYTGKSMAESHQQLKITGKEWEAFMDDVWLTLDKFKVPAGEQTELRAIVNSTRSDIVFGPEHTQGVA
jgi:hemoglobin